MVADGHALRCNALVRGQVLLVATSAGKLPISTDDERSATGAWLSEIAVPYCVLTSRGYDVTIASVRGGEVPVDPVSVKASLEGEGPETAERVKRFLACDTASQMMRASVPVSAVAGLSTYRALFLAGGHGASVDFPTCDKLGALVREALTTGLFVAVLCHGSAVFASEEMGKVVRGKRLAAFSDAEEDQVGRKPDVPFLLETRLRDLGVSVSTGKPSSEHVEKDGNLLSGQNPASAAKLAVTLADALDSSSPTSTGDVLTAPVATHPGSMRASSVEDALGVPLERTSAGGQAQHGAAATVATTGGGGSGFGLPVVGSGREEAAAEAEEQERVKEPTLQDNLGINAMPNPGTNADNTSPASG